MRENLALTLSPSVPRGGQGRGSQETGGGSQALRQFCLKPSPQKPSFSPTFPMELSQERRWVARGLQRLWKEGMHLENPAIKWKPSPTAPRSPASITSQLQNVGDGTGRWGETRTIAPRPSHVGPALPHPHSWGGGQGRERASGAGLWRGGVVVPGGRKRRKKLLPLWPTPHPGPHLRPQGPSKQDGGGGREDGVRAQALGQVRPGRLGGGRLCSEKDPRKPGGSPGPGGRRTPRVRCHEYFLLESLFGVIFPPRRGYRGRVVLFAYPHAGSPGYWQLGGGNLHSYTTPPPRTPVRATGARHRLGAERGPTPVPLPPNPASAGGAVAWHPRERSFGRSRRYGPDWAPRTGGQGLRTPCAHLLGRWGPRRWENVRSAPTVGQAGRKQ